MVVAIRSLEEDDIDGVCELWQELAQMREEITETRILNEDAPDYFFGYATGLLQRRDSLCLVADDDGELVGYLIATKQRRPPIYHHTRVAYLSDAYIQKSHRRKGIMKQFAQELEAWAQREGVTAIDVQVFQNNEMARDIYRHLGFSDYRTLLRKEIAEA